MIFVDRLTIKSKLILTLVLVSVLSVAAVGYIALRIGKQTIVESVFEHLTSVRASKAGQIESYFRQLRDHAATLAEDDMILRAMEEFSAGFDALAEVPVAGGVAGAVEDYYRNQMLPRLARNLEGAPVLEHYLPTEAAARYLQYHYIAANPQPPGGKAGLDRADDASDYSAVHAHYHPRLRNIAQRFGYHDIFLIDARTRAVVYSVSKEADFATRLDTGPYALSGLARVATAALRSPDLGFVALEDFEPYRASEAAPAAFIASPVLRAGQVIGVLALQLPVDEINAIMTGGQRWRDDGLGDTGETYLVGRDWLMRSNSRFLIEEDKREQYFSDLKRAGVDSGRIERIRNLGTSILLQEVRTQGVSDAHIGTSGTRQILDYRGVPVLSSFAPLELVGLNWAILSEIDVAEAYAPMRGFTYFTFVAIAVVVFVVTIVAMLLAEAFAAPVRALVRDVGRIRDGETRRVVGGYRDEYAELARRVDETVAALDAHSGETQELNRRYERLVQRVLPRQIVTRLLADDEPIAAHYPNVTVLFGDVTGLSALSERMSPGEYVEMINKLVGAFDDATQRHGVEKFKTVGCDYVAVSGLSVVRVDHARCVVDFALDMFAIMRRFNRDWGTELGLCAGISSGPVVAAVVGRDRIAYDITGRSIRMAKLLAAHAPPDSLRVSDEIRSSLGPLYQFEDCGSVELRDGTSVRAWSVRRQADGKDTLALKAGR